MRTKKRGRYERHAYNVRCEFDLPHPGDKHLTIVLVHLNKREHAQEWVTWMHNRETGGYFEGHYCDSEKEARQDYAERVAEWCAAFLPKPEADDDATDGE